MKSYIYCALLPFVFLVLSGYAGASGQADGASQADIVSGIEIRIDYPGETGRWEKLAGDVVGLYIRAGEHFSENEVKASISALKQCGSFRAIDVNSRGDGGGITLVYTLTPFDLIKEIIVRGQYPFFKTKILNAMTVYPGDAFVQKVVDAQSRPIADLYKREGYIDPRVVIGSWQDPEDRHFILFVNIEKGPYYTLGRIDYRGNQTFEDSVLNWRMGSWRRAIFGRAAGRFKMSVFRDDINNLKRFYRKHHFSDVAVSYKLVPDANSERMEVEITIHEGPLYEVAFTGNRAFGDRKLRSSFSLFQMGNKGGLGLRRSLKEIKALYHRAGYLDIHIEVDQRKWQESGILRHRFHLTIEEGLKAVVDRVSISGNSAYSTRKVGKQILTRPPGFLHGGAFVPEILEEDLLMIQNLYHKKGYMNPQIEAHRAAVPDEEGRNRTAIDIRIEEGVRTRIAAVSFEGLDAVPEKRMTRKIGLKKGRPFRQYELNNDERRIAAELSENGHPYASVKGHSTLSEDGSSARVVFVVDQGPKIEMGNTHYSGNFRTKKRILDRELEMKPGEAFSLQRMHTGQKNIRAMNIFRSVQFRPVGLKDGKDTIHLFADVDEKDPYSFQANGGYESSKGLYAGSRLGDHNFLGLNKDVWVGGEVSQTGYWAESGVFEPRFLGTRISSDLSLFLERDEPFNQTFGTMAYGVDLFFSRKLTHRLTGNLGFRWERRQQFDRGSDTVEDDEVEDPRSILVTTPSIGYDSRDSFIRPRRGIFSFAAVDLSKGIENSLDDFYKYRFELRGFTTPLPRLTLAGRGSFGDIDPYGTGGVVPEDQLFFLGGTSSIRGFDQNLFLYDGQNDPVGGELAAVASAEMRIDMGRNFEFSVFYDVGYLDDTSGEEVTDNVRDAVGLGLRYVTPVGAMGVLYGHKLDPRPEESDGRIHFSIGYTF